MVPLELKDLNNVQIFKSEIRKWGPMQCKLCLSYIHIIGYVYIYIYNIYIYIYIIYIYIYVWLCKTWFLKNKSAHHHRHHHHHHHHHHHYVSFILLKKLLCILCFLFLLLFNSNKEFHLGVTEMNSHRNSSGDEKILFTHKFLPEMKQIESHSRMKFSLKIVPYLWFFSSGETCRQFIIQFATI